MESMAGGDVVEEATWPIPTTGLQGLVSRVVGFTAERTVVHGTEQCQTGSSVPGCPIGQGHPHAQQIKMTRRNISSSSWGKNMFSVLLLRPLSFRDDASPIVGDVVPPPRFGWRNKRPPIRRRSAAIPMSDHLGTQGKIGEGRVKDRWPEPRERGEHVDNGFKLLMRHGYRG